MDGLGLGFLLGGTIGNGIDRLRLGHVTDFLELMPIQFAIFNWADVAINLAVLCFVIDALTQRKGPAMPDWQRPAQLTVHRTTRQNTAFLCWVKCGSVVTPPWRSGSTTVRSAANMHFWSDAAAIG